VQPPFFPDPVFAWMYYLALLGCAGGAVVSDVKTQRLPNGLTVSMFMLGLIMQCIRGGWLGARHVPGSYFGLTGPLGGVVEGLCFSLAGFATAFAFFFVLWQLRACGAGDVKLMAAYGAWIGPVWFFFVFAGTIVAVLVVMALWWGYAFLRHKNPGLKLSYALPAFLGLAPVMLWVWRKTLLA
jgi:Flp pilus assembly protein protease CpaA